MCEFSESEFIADLKRMHKYERQQEEGKNRNLIHLFPILFQLLY